MRLAVVLALCTMLLGLAAPAHMTGEFNRRAVDDLVNEQLTALGAPGVAVAITHGDQVLYTRGYGDAGDDRPVTADTQFRIASLSKAFTATAVLQLVTSGQVDLDEPAMTYLPEFSPNDPRGAEITVRQLLNQTSGLTDQSFPAATLPQPDTLKQRVQSMDNAELSTGPGAHYQYCNVNYSVLARLVEVISGQPFPDYLRQHVLTPLGMNNTFTAPTSQAGTQAATNLAQGHVLLFGGSLARPELDGFLGGYGGVVSTATDMAHWLVMQSQQGRWHGRQILKPDAVALMHTPPPRVNGDYAMGWWVTHRAHGPDLLEHNGVLSTFHAEQALVPSTGYGVVVLYNSGNALADYHALTTGLIALLQDQGGEQPGLGTHWIGIALAVATLLVLLWRVRSLARVRRWTQRHRARSLWRPLPGLVWLLLPTALLAGLPWIVAETSGRVFTRVQLLWAMPSITIFLAMAAVTGIALIVARAWCWRRGARGPT